MHGFQSSVFWSNVFCEHRGGQLISCFSSPRLNDLANYPLSLLADGKRTKLITNFEENGELCTLFFCLWWLCHFIKIVLKSNFKWYESPYYFYRLWKHGNKKHVKMETRPITGKQVYAEQSRANNQNASIYCIFHKLYTIFGWCMHCLTNLK